MKEFPLSDLSFFRFPDLTAGTVVGIVALLLLLTAVALGAVVLQRLVFEWVAERSRRQARVARTGVGRLPAPQREVLEKLARFSSGGDADRLVHDPAAYEAAVAALAPQATPEELEALGGLRRTFHLNVMNPEVVLTSTRQLLPDLPVRVLAGSPGEKLDLYCALLDLDEQFLYFDLSYQEEVSQLLRRHPTVLLNYWREEGGETLFRIHLEPVAGPGELPLFRAPHAGRAYDAANRTEFRLSVDFPLRYVFLERDAVKQLRSQRGGEAPPEGGEGRLQDLSYGGAAFLAERGLPAGGYAQLRFEIQGNPVRLMVEPISNTHLPDGRTLVRGRLRGMPHEAKTLLFNFLSREQIKRLREKGALFSRPAP